MKPTTLMTMVFVGVIVFTVAWDLYILFDIKLTNTLLMITFTVVSALSYVVSLWCLLHLDVKLPVVST